MNGEGAIQVEQDTGRSKQIILGVIAPMIGSPLVLWLLQVVLNITTLIGFLFVFAGLIIGAVGIGFIAYRRGYRSFALAFLASVLIVNAGIAAFIGAIVCLVNIFCAPAIGI